MPLIFSGVPGPVTVLSVIQKASASGAQVVVGVTVVAGTAVVVVIGATVVVIGAAVVGAIVVVVGAAVVAGTAVVVVAAAVVVGTAVVVVAAAVVVGAIVVVGSGVGQSPSVIEATNQLLSQGVPAVLKLRSAGAPPNAYEIYHCEVPPFQNMYAPLDALYQ